MQLSSYYHSVLIVLQILTVIIFAKGFFMIREYLPDINIIPPPTEQNSKVVMLIFDSFRVDFLANEHFTFFKEKLKTNDNQTLLYLSVADNPTVTLARIEGMTTGNLPSFINLKSNFKSSTIQEDNFIWQLRRSNKTTVFAGDDTWTSIFPEISTMYPYDSFNVFDLDTVDNGVIEHVLEELKNDQWSLMIGHMLGLDHVGHGYNYDEQLMDQKLAQFSQFLEQVYAGMSNDTMLIVLGDHGQTDTGNHGGESDEETNTVLFATYKGDKRFYKEFGQKLDDIKIKEIKNQQVRKYIKDSINYTTPLVDRSYYMRRVQQIDLAPTIANVLGISIPFNSLGVFIPEFTLLDKDEKLSDGQRLSLAICMTNLDQVMVYIRKIQQLNSKFQEELFKKWLNQYGVLTGLYSSGDQNMNLNVLGLLHDIQITCKKIWNEYDYLLMKLAMALYFMIFGLTIQVIRILHFYKEVQQNQIILETNMDSNDGCSNNEALFFKPITFVYNNYQIILVSIFCQIALYSYLSIEWTYWLSLYIFLYTCCLTLTIELKIRQLINQLKHINSQIVNTKGQLIEIDYFMNQTSHSGPIEQGYFQFFLWFKLKVGHAWILLALTYMRREDESLFWTLLSSLIVFLIVDHFMRFKRDKKNYFVINQLILTLIIIAAMFLAEQYDINNLGRFWSSLKLHSYNYIFNNFFMTILLPSLSMQLFLKQFLAYTFDKEEYQQRQQQVSCRTQILLAHLTLTMIQLYFAVNWNSSELSQSGLVKIVLPRIIYLSSIFGFILAIRSPTTVRSELRAIFGILPIILLTGEVSQAIFLLYFLCIGVMWFLLRQTIKQYGPFFFFGSLSVITSYFWFMLGNRCFISAINVEAAYVGFQNFNLYLSGSLLIINQLNFFMASIFILPILSDLIDKILISRKTDYSLIADYKEKTYLDAHKRLYLVMFQSHYFIQIMITSINCYYNTDQVLLSAVFAPKFIFDAVSFMGTSALSILII